MLPCSVHFISIHALRGEGDVNEGAISQYRKGISIHALRGEGDYFVCALVNSRIISIHALRGEGDQACAIKPARCVHFNPRPPWGGRPKTEETREENQRFQSTPSVGRATEVGRAPCKACWNISIHALRGEGDVFLVIRKIVGRYFNPRPPWGGRP